MGQVLIRIVADAQELQAGLTAGKLLPWVSQVPPVPE